MTSVLVTDRSSTPAVRAKVSGATQADRGSYDSLSISGSAVRCRGRHHA